MCVCVCVFLQYYVSGRSKSVSVQIMGYVAPHIPLVKNPPVIKNGVPPEKRALKLWIIKKKTVNQQTENMNDLLASLNNIWCSGMLWFPSKA